MLTSAILFSLLGGSGIFLGGLLAGREHIRPRWLENELRHSVMAFGGGALLSAVALVLVPEGLKDQPVTTLALTFLAGGLFFMMFERYLASHKTAAAQLVAMLLDFIPEAIIIGAIITRDFNQALLLSVLIFVQNVPESFNAFCEIEESKGFSSGKLVLFFLAIGCSGPLYALGGIALFRNHHTLLAMLMTFCAGGILYIVFNNIAPGAKLKRHWWPSMGALLGFLAGTIGKILIH